VDGGLRVVVTGGAGFIGSHIVRRYLAAGANVLVLDDLSGGSRDAVPAGAGVAVADVTDPAVTELIAAHRPALIVHAAAQTSVPRSVADPAHDRLVNVTGTQNVVRAASDAGARVVFLSSGGAIYGEADGADETTPAAPISPYGRHKLEAEDIVRGSPHGYGIARLANVYGPGQRSDNEGGVIAVFVERLLRGERIDIHGDGEQRRDFVHVDDVVSALSLIASADRSGVWNVATGVATSVNQLLAKLVVLTDVNQPPRHVARRSGDVKTSRLAIGRLGMDLGWTPAIGIDAGLAGMVSGTT
jgi:UDP-glucose 4-epimerase